MTHTRLHGILPATITPFDQRGRFARSIFERLLERLHAAGIDGVYVCGTTGEGLLQPLDQRRAVVEAAVACNPPRRQVIAHVGAASLADAISLAEHAARSGAHAVSSLPPLSGPFSPDDVHRYYEALAAASDLPLIVYYFPPLAPSISSPAALERLCDIPNVAGVKFTDFDLYTLSQVKRADRCVFNGRDEVLAAGLLMGADGGIGTFYNLVPELFVGIYAAATSGAWTDAQTLQRRVNTLVRITRPFSLFPAVRQILSWSGLPCGDCLPPRAALSSDEQRALQDGLVQAGFGDLTAARQA